MEGLSSGRLSCCSPTSWKNIWTQDTHSIDSTVLSKSYDDANVVSASFLDYLRKHPTFLLDAPLLIQMDNNPQ